MKASTKKDIWWISLQTKKTVCIQFNTVIQATITTSQNKKQECVLKCQQEHGNNKWVENNSADE